MRSLLFAILLVPHVVLAGSAKQLEEEIEALRRVNEAQATNLAAAVNQMQEVLSEFQKLYGKVDQSLYVNTEQDKFIKDNQRRLEILEEKNQLLLTQLEEIKTAGLLKPDLVRHLKAFKVYQQALGEVNAEQYKTAVASLNTFLVNYPKTDYADNAQYWIGESLFAMQDYPASIAEFQKVVKKFPKSEKIAPSMLKQGFAFFQMQSLPEAKAFLAKLIKQFPASDESTRAREKISEIDQILEEREKAKLEEKAALQ